ncbi:MAG: hypothetical protein H6Q73_4168 [Firmicutes bacterium]|nr:hypothetical protein [Bacillota bacterium]
MESEHSLPGVGNDPVLKALNGRVSASGKEAIHDNAFTYDGYQVVRGEFFAHVYEPSITFNNCKVSLNTACLKRLPDIDYVQILVNPADKKLAVRPSSENEKDSFLWCTTKNTKRKPKQITCHLFFAKVVQLMEWNPDYRYKLLGKLIRSGDEYLFIFDLTATEIYQRILHEGEKPKTSRTPVFPAEWQNQFGLPVEAHRRLLQVNIFDGYTVFGIKDKSGEAPVDGSKEQPIRGG